MGTSGGGDDGRDNVSLVLLCDQCGREMWQTGVGVALQEPDIVLEIREYRYRLCSRKCLLEMANSAFVPDYVRSMQTLVGEP